MGKKRVIVTSEGNCKVIKEKEGYPYKIGDNHRWVVIEGNPNEHYILEMVKEGNPLPFIPDADFNEIFEII